MNSSTPSLAPLRSVAITITAVLTVVAAVAIGRRTGVLDPELAKRFGVLVFGIMLAVLGNYLPKFVVPWSTPAAVSARRFAGWVFVVAGSAYVVTCLLAPMPQAVVASSVIGIVAFVVAGANWTRVVRHTGRVQGPDAEATPEGNPSATAGVARAAMSLLFALFFVFVVFLSDALWGDAVARWMAVGYCVLTVIVMGSLRRS
jgi:hypothetical protein